MKNSISKSNRALRILVVFLYVMATLGAVISLTGCNSGKVDVITYEDSKTWFHEDLICIVIDGKYGYVDKTGKTVIEPKYDYAYSFYNGLAAVVVKDSDGVLKYGFIDKSGKYVVEPKYERAGNFTDSLAPV